MMLAKAQKWVHGKAIRLAVRIAQYSTPTPTPRPVPILGRCADLFGWRAYTDLADLQKYEVVQLWRIAWPRPITMFSDTLSVPGERPGFFWRPHTLPAVNSDAVSFGMQRH